MDTPVVNTRSKIYNNNNIPLKENKMKISESIIIGVDISENGDTPVLLVGRKQSEKATEIINAFQGEEAIELYMKLITKKEK